MTITEWAKATVLRLAKVPAEPHVPEGAQESVRLFNAGRNYFKWRLILWGLGNTATAIGLFGVLSIGLFARFPPLVRTIWVAVDSFAIGVFIASLGVTFFLQLLNYEMRWYIVTDRSLRIRSGVVFLQEITMTFANIQEIRVTANPIERLLGLANVEVRSAGGGVSEHGASTGHVGKFEGVDNAEAIRDLMIERLRIYRDSGLGEKTEEAREPASVAAAREVLQQTRALRAALKTTG